MNPTGALRLPGRAWAASSSTPPSSAPQPLPGDGLVPLFPGWSSRPWPGGVSLAPLSKMTAGMFLTCSPSWPRRWCSAHRRRPPPHALWQFPPYLFLTTGEVLVSVTGLEFAYTQAPAQHEAHHHVVLVADHRRREPHRLLVSQFNRFHGAAYFGFFAGPDALLRPPSADGAALPAGGVPPAECSSRKPPLSGCSGSGSRCCSSSRPRHLAPRPGTGHRDPLRLADQEPRRLHVLRGARGRRRFSPAG